MSLVLLTDPAPGSMAVASAPPGSPSLAKWAPGDAKKNDSCCLLMRSEQFRPWQRRPTTNPPTITVISPFISNGYDEPGSGSKEWS